MRPIGGHVSIAGGLPQAIANTQKIGGNCLQIFAGSPRLWYRKPFSRFEVNQFLAKKQAHQIGDVFIHALYLVNLATDNQDLLDKSINSLIADMHNASLIGSPGVIVHLGSHQGRGFDTVKNQLLVAIQKILKETQNVSLILENDAGQNGKIGSLEELSFLITSLSDSRLKVCLDTAHLFASGVDYRLPNNLDFLVAKLKSLLLLDKIICLHLNDSASDLDSHRDLHANLGEGKIGLSALGSLINHPALSHLPLILEVPGANHSGPDLVNMEIAQSLTRI